jgi:hypothetical protein
MRYWVLALCREPESSGTTGRILGMAVQCCACEAAADYRIDAELSRGEGADDEIWKDQLQTLFGVDHKLTYATYALVINFLYSPLTFPSRRVHLTRDRKRMENL